MEIREYTITLHFHKHQKMPKETESKDTEADF